jgi:hypothetical protein
MSIVLKALEKAQKEKNTKIPKPIIEASPLEPLAHFSNNEESTVTIIRIDEQPKLQQIENHISKTNPISEAFPHRYTILRKNIFLVWGLLCIGIIGLISINWWITQNHPEISKLKTTNDNTNTPAQSKISAIKNIILEPNLPQLKITGVMWDNKEPIALINGKCLKTGDEINGAKIVNIQQKEVSVLFKEKEFTISVE